MAKARFVRDPVKGTIRDTVTGEEFEDVNVRSDTFHDSVIFTAGSTAAGTKKTIFRDLSDKDLLHTSLTQTKKIPENNIMKMNRVGVYLHQANGNTLTNVDDVLKMICGAVMTFKLNSQEIVKGPLYKFPSGFGATGQTTANNRSLVTVGPPSLVAVPELEQEQILTDKTELNTQLEVTGADWITNASGPSDYVQPSFANDVVVAVHIGGLIEKPTNT